MTSGNDSTVSVLDLMCKDRYAESNEHKRKREEYAAEARNWAQRREQYRERSKEALKEAEALRPKRDAVNEEVRQIKERRDKAHAEAQELKGKDKEAYAKAREAANAIHEELLAAVERGHRINEEMSALYEESKVDRILSQAAHRKFVEARRNADREHNEFLESRKSIRGMRDEYTGRQRHAPGQEYRCPQGEEGRDALARMNEHHAPLTDWALSLIPGIEVNEILDIGCGGGMCIGKLHSKYPSARLHGIDISDESVKATSENNRDIEGLDVRKASVSEIPFDDGAFQHITAVETYFFWPELHNDIKSAARCLAPGGAIVIVSETYPHPGQSEHDRQSISEYRMNIVENEVLADMMKSAGLDVRFETVPEKSWVTFIGIKGSE